MRRRYFPVRLDYDDYPIGSPGPSFYSQEEAEKYMNGYYGRYDQVNSDLVFDSYDEYEKWMAGEVDE